MNLKRTIRRLLPAPVFNAVQSVRRSLVKPDPRIEAARVKFLALQHGVPEGHLAIRPGLVLATDPESRDPFQWFCYRSIAMVDELDSFLQEAVRYGSFADIGANHGIFSLCFLSRVPQGRALAVDPSPIAFRILNHNKQLNAFDRLQTHNVACGNQEGSVHMRANWHHLEAVLPGKAGGEPTREIPMSKLDTLCESENFWPEVIKIDVEGFERQVIEGAVETLRRAKLLYLEIHPGLIEDLGYRSEEVFDALAAVGYQPFGLHGEPLSREYFRDWMHTFWTICQPTAQV